MSKINDLVDIIFWDETEFRTTFARLQEILGIKNILRTQVKDYKPVKTVSSMEF